MTLTLLVQFQECTTLIQRLSCDSNQEIMNVTVDYINNGDKDAMISLTLDVFETILTMKSYLTIRLPTDKNDRTFQKELMKTSIDVGKIFSGNAGNFFIKGILDNLLKAIDFKPILPIPPVILPCEQLFIITTLFVS